MFTNKTSVLSLPGGAVNMRRLETGCRCPLGKENILTYLLRILELNIEPA
jgi:hypothetical protein